MCLILTNCGVQNSRISAPDKLPPSNIQVEEKALEKALENLALFPGHSMKIMYQVVGNDKKSDMMRLIAPEVLLRKNFLLVNEKAEKKESFPLLRITVHDLKVILKSGHSNGNEKRIERTAESEISAVFFGSNGTRQVFTGKGTFNDSFESYLLDTVMGNDPYVIDQIKESRFNSVFKPAIIGVVLTVFSWMLYSYRG